jgi:hypothetical protein
LKNPSSISVIRNVDEKTDLFALGYLARRVSIVYAKRGVCRDQSTRVFLDGHSGSRMPVLPPLRGETSLINTARQAADSFDMLSHAVPGGFLDLSLEAERPGSTDRTSLFRG